MKIFRIRSLIFLTVLTLIFACNLADRSEKRLLKISGNGRFLTTADGKPFFWLGDTGWLLFNRLTREEADRYLEDRKIKGFNVVQAMLLHDVPSRNVYLDSSLVRANVGEPAITPGNDFKDSVAYDYWDHIDYIIDKAAEKGIYMALVPVWGTNVKEKKVNVSQAAKYAAFIAKRFKDKWNIIWLNGGDIKGSDGMDVWQIIGKTIRENDPNHLITFHPRGRTASSDWFHNAPWLDFNMVQSGHRNYEQDTSKKEKNHYGPDNWKYIEVDYALKPVKPTIDGEPSYEDIPQGLHDTLQPRWTAADVRRYGYWSVFAGAFGYTYGHNSVMQMFKLSDEKPAYGPHDEWYNALNAEGAAQMKHLKNLILSKSYFDRVPDQSLVAGLNGDKYNHIVATRGEKFALFYVYNGNIIHVNLGKIEGKEIVANWFDPRTGKTTLIGKFKNTGTREFHPPGGEKEANDWVLVMDSL